MQYFTRSLVASALAVPLLVAAAGSALAAETSTGATVTDRASLNHDGTCGNDGNCADGHYPVSNGFDYRRDYGRTYYYHDGYNYGGYTYEGHYRLLGIL